MQSASATASEQGHYLCGDPHTIDRDGLIVPEHLRHARIDKWEKMPLRWRQGRSQDDLARTEKERAKLAAKAAAPVRAPATRFTTDYAIKWGRAQGWKLIDRENYDHKNRRHHDLQLGLDALFDDGGDGMVGIQGAGRNEKAAHYERFVSAGGTDKATRRHIRVIYLEFERGNFEPILREDWA